MSRLAVSVAGATAAVAMFSCATMETGAECDRACLRGVADSYLAAIAAHDPELAPLSDDVVFVENITRMGPGEGLWASAAGEATDFRIYVLDAAAGAVGMITVIDRGTADGVAPVLLAARLKIEDGEITEAEHVLGESALDGGGLAHLETPRPDLVADVPEDARAPRGELVAIAATYYEALNRNDGSLAPFADDCERQENGVVTASPDLAPAPFNAVDVNGAAPPPVVRDCTGQMSSGRFAYVDSIDNRRVFAADPVQGLAMGLSHFRASMSHGAIPVTAADGSVVMWEEQREPYDLPAAHIFKITGGEIHEVEAIGFYAPYQSPTGWE